MWKHNFDAGKWLKTSKIALATIDHCAVFGFNGAVMLSHEMAKICQKLRFFPSYLALVEISLISPLSESHNKTKTNCLA